MPTATSRFSRATTLPGILAHQLKPGAYYKVTDKWTLGANRVHASSVYRSATMPNWLRRFRLTPRSMMGRRPSCNDFILEGSQALHRSIDK
jgi:hypothetical protein